ncbi:MAG: outer membrane protein assembly factor BamE [Desulfobacteraceae bacterium]|nr:outer membrane protein assembly factor BamE [Desulfobacteraceae bacterium]
MIRNRIMTILVICCISCFTGCVATRHAANTQAGLQGDKLTVGTVQKEIKKGMSGAEVAAALGSPNIVSTDEQGREVWIYDKISTDRVQSESSGYGTLILLGYRGSSGSSSTSQKTLTVIIKFDNDKKVRDFAYHTSRF